MGKITTLPPVDLVLLPQVTGPASLLAGVDEVGRGCLFGPVVAATILLPLAQVEMLVKLGVKDSKLLSAKKRDAIAQKLKELGGEYRIGYAKAAEIDRLNIRQASLLAMERSLSKLSRPPVICLVDGRDTIPRLPFPQQALLQGDQRSPLIAAASIIAKVWRDELITRWADKYPEYHLAQNKGYGTEEHRRALEKYGISPQHRRSFRPCSVLAKG